MVFNGDTNQQDIVSLARKMAGADADALPESEIVSYANIVSAKVWHAIFKSYGGATYNDSNQAGDPFIEFNLDTSRTYTLPEETLTIKSIEILDQSDNWVLLHATTQESINTRSAVQEYQDTPGNPREYSWSGNKLTLYPAANYNKTNGVRIYTDKADVEFAVGDTTKTPGFSSIYHEVLPIGIALQYCQIEGKERESKLKEQYIDLVGDEKRGILGEIPFYYANRFKALGNANVRQPQSGSFVDNYG